MARSGMAYLISELRGLTQAGVNDYTIGTVTYWTDDVLQTALDTTRVYHNRLPMVCEPTYGAGSVTYTYFLTGLPNWEDGGTIQGTGGTVVGTAAYSFSPRSGEVLFSADTAGSAFEYTGWTYDPYAAAADVWRRKASHYAERYDVSTDNHNLERSQLVSQCLQMAAYYGGMGGAATGHSVYMERGDC